MPAKDIKRVKISGILLLLFSLFSTSSLLSQQQSQTDLKTFNSTYNEGKYVFYKTLKQEAAYIPLKKEDKEMLLDAEKKMSGLYEHLMNFYYFHEKLYEEKATHLRSLILNLSRNMAIEFIQSIPEAFSKKEISLLNSLLYSTGYFSRKMFPIFRKYSRSIGKYVRRQWAFDDLRVREAHSFSKGRGIKLAIIDSGVDSILRNIRSKIFKWKNFLDGSKPIKDKGKFPYDWSGHGTSIASIVTQVAPEIELLVIKVFDDETMRTVSPTRWSHYLFSAGLLWAAQNSADVISISASLRTDTKSLREASRFCWDRNIVIVSSVANVSKKKNKKNPYFPASYPWTIAVGGIEKNKRKYEVYKLSSQGDHVDVVAPASGVLVEMPSYLRKIRRPRISQGTSVAVPFVAGTAALILSAIDKQILMKLKERPGELVERVRTILRETSSNKKLGFQSPNPFTGWGLIDTEKAVRMAKNLRIED